MKLIILAAALAFGGTALAQTAPETPQDRQNGADQTAGGYAQGPTYNRVPLTGEPRVAPTGPTPDQAFPAPAPQHYPWCRPRQFDHCRQRGG